VASLEERIREKLGADLSPSVLEVVNESGMHNVPKGSETHFKVVIVSATFEGMPQVARHRRIYAVLAEEMKAGVHALAITSRSPGEWAKAPEANESPLCRGGSKA
jgi:BolA protein